MFANKIDKDGAQCISEMIRNKQFLTCLGLSNNKLYKAGAMEIAQNGLNGKTQLVKLSIENNGIGTDGLAAISRALKHCRGIQELYLYNNELENESMEEFSKLLQN